MDFEIFEKYFDENLKCSNCEKMRYFFDKCVFCKNNDFIKNLKIFSLGEKNDVVKKLKKLKINKLNDEKENNKILSEYSKFKKFNINEPMNDTKKSLMKICHNNTISIFEKANMCIQQKYCNLFESVIDENIQECPTTTIENIKQYITALIKHEHIKSSIMHLTYFLEVIHTKNIQTPCMKEYRQKSKYEIKFLYNLYCNNQILNKLKWFICEYESPMLVTKQNMRFDFTFVFDISEVNRIVHLEIDDYCDYEKLTGGHGTQKRIIRDILKDTYCWAHNNSLIRITNMENPIDALYTFVLNTTSFPMYRFYDNYFNNKNNIDGYNITETSNNKHKASQPIIKMPMSKEELEQYRKEKALKEANANKRLLEIISKCSNSAKKPTENA